MHIAVVNLTRGHLSGGYRRYLQNVLPLIRHHPRVSRLDTYIPATAGCPSSEVAVQEFDPHRLGIRKLKKQILFSNPDVVFIPTARWLDSPFPTVCMIRNMLPLVAPFTERSPRIIAANLIGRRQVRQVLRKADRIIAVSHFVHKTLANHWKADPSRIGVVHHGVASLASEEAYEVPSRLPPLAKSGFIFGAGSLYSYRGFQDLIEAAALLGSNLSRLPILLAGTPNRAGQGRYEKKMHQLIASLGLHARFEWLGNLAPSEMAWCYHHCTIFISTSRVEACPNTVLEAMRHRSLIVSTDAPPMPELLGSGAVYYEGGNAKSLATAITHVTQCPASERTALRDLAAKRSRAFSWEACVERTVDQLDLALNG